MTLQLKMGNSDGKYDQVLKNYEVCGEGTYRTVFN